MCKISKHAYKYQMKRQEEQRSTHGVYCSSARKHKLIYVTETNYLDDLYAFALEYAV